MSKAGPILGLIGGLMLLIGAVIVAGLGGALASESAGWTILLGIAAIISGIAGIEGREDGNAVLLVVGVMAVIGMYISLGSFTIYSIPVSVSLTSTLGYVDPFLILVGGIAGLAYPEKPVSPSPLQQQNIVLERWKNLEVTEDDVQIDKVFCSQCGAENSRWAKFCKICNSPVALELQKISPSPEEDFRGMQTEIMDKDPIMRGMAVVDLGSFGAEHPKYKDQAIALLEKCLNDPDEDVRTSARQSLDMVSNKKFIDYQMDAQEILRVLQQSSVSKVFCTQCGFQNKTTAKFCKRCGATIE